MEADENQDSVQVLLAVRALTLERMKSYLHETATLKLQRKLLQNGYISISCDAAILQSVEHSIC